MDPADRERAEQLLARDARKQEKKKELITRKTERRVQSKEIRYTNSSGGTEWTTNKELSSDASIPVGTKSASTAIQANGVAVGNKTCSRCGRSGLRLGSVLPGSL